MNTDDSASFHIPAHLIFVLLNFSSSPRKHTNQRKEM